MTEPSASYARRRGEAADAREFVSFRVGAQEFCVDIMCVREIRGFTPATALPQAPGFVRGVVNLRGVVLPVVDLAARLGFAPTEPTPRHVIIVAKVGRQLIGLLVDAVSDILSVAPEMLQPTPDVGGEAARAFVRGVLAVDGRMISQIALDHALAGAGAEAAA